MLKKYFFRVPILVSNDSSRLSTIQSKIKFHSKKLFTKVYQETLRDHVNISPIIKRGNSNYHGYNFSRIFGIPHTTTGQDNIGSRCCNSTIVNNKYYHQTSIKSSSLDQIAPNASKENNEFLDNDPNSPPNSKLLKIAIIGVPNSGKSTLINQLIGWRVCSVSQKVHTTQCNARAVFNNESTQLIYLDTPGIVTPEEVKKYRLKKSLVLDPEISLNEADLIAVLHDVSNHYTHHSLHPRIIRLLTLYPTIPSILILNKVDKIRNKGHLLTITNALTDCLVGNSKAMFKSTSKEDKLRKYLLPNKASSSSSISSFQSSTNKFKSGEVEDNSMYYLDPTRDNVEAVHKEVEGNNVQSVDELDKQNSLDVNNINNDSINKMSTQNNVDSTNKPHHNNVDSRPNRTLNQMSLDEESQTSLRLFDLETSDPNLTFEDVLAGKKVPTEKQVQHLIAGRKGWPKFDQVFMISALEGSGVQDVKEYFMKEAKAGNWIFGDDVITDQTPQEMALLTVREKCLEHLPHNIPYQLKFQLMHWHMADSELLSILVGVYCVKKSHLRLLIGPSGRKVKTIATEAEQALRNTFRNEVRLRINFEFDPKKRDTDI